jgi:hypothetical protein
MMPKTGNCLWVGLFCYDDVHGGRGMELMFTVAVSKEEANESIDRYLVGSPDVEGIVDPPIFLVLATHDRMEQEIVVSKLLDAGYRFAPPQDVPAQVIIDMVETLVPR